MAVCSALSWDQLPVLSDSTSRTSFQNLLDRADFTQMDGMACQACLEDRLPGNPVANDDNAIDRYVEELSSVTQKTLAATATKELPRADERTTLSVSIQDEHA